MEKKSDTFGVRTPMDIAEWLRKEKARRDRSFSYIINEVLRDYYDRYIVGSFDGPGPA